MQRRRFSVTKSIAEALAAAAWISGVVGICGCAQPCSDVKATYAEVRPVAVLQDYTVELEPVEVTAEEIYVEYVEEYAEEYVEEPIYDIAEDIAVDQKYECWEETYPDLEGYSQEDCEDTWCSSNAEWAGAVASAYSTWCNGGTSTASGIPLDDCTPTVASLWLPLGSYIEVMYGDTSVVCQVTDRGPYVDGRDLDLSLGAVNALGISSTDEWGVREVSYRPL